MLWRAVRLLCPRCGEGKLFTGWLKMAPRCPHCQLKLDRGPGYYLGAIYVNYGLTSLITTAAFLIGRFRWHIPGQQLLWPLFAFCILFPLLISRQARAIWLAMDCQLDSTVLEEEETDEEFNG
jgi:uncharacterized protein (DUF983 family)